MGQVVFDADRAVEWAKEGRQVILVRPETSPEDVAGMYAAEGIVTARGGRTSHAAVVAVGMGKPCIVGAGGIVVHEDRRTFEAGGRTVREGDVISIDGETGEVIIDAIKLSAPEVTGAAREFLAWADRYRTLGVRANADTPEDARRAREFGAEGIGLVRTEHMFFAADRISIVREMIMASDTVARRAAVSKLLPFQREDFIGIFRAMEGLPVTIRLLDPPLHEFLANPKEYREMLEERARLDALGINPARKDALDERLAKIDALREANPMLGHRGCRLGITSPEIYAMQVRAIMEAACTAVEQGVKVEPEIMIPLTGTVGEMKLTYGNTKKVADAVLVEMGVTVKYTVGTMIEVPRAALIADKIAQDAEFFSFGTNDLTQMTFGYSRDDVAKFLPEYLQKGLLPARPVLGAGPGGRGRAGQDRHRARPADAARSQDRHLRRARRRAVVRRILSPGRHDLRVVLTVHDSHRQAERGPGAHQGARGVGRRRPACLGRPGAWDRGAPRLRRGATSVGGFEGGPFRGPPGGSREIARGADRAGVSEAGRRRPHLRPARRRRAADLRRAVRLRGAAPHPGPPGGGGRPRGGGLRALDRESRRVPGHLGTGLHESRDRAAGRHDGFDSHRRVHRAGARPT